MARWYCHLVFPKSVNSIFRTFLLAPVTRNILVHSLFRDQSKLASRFEAFSEDEIWAIHEAAAPTNTKRATKFGLLAFTGR